MVGGSNDVDESLTIEADNSSADEAGSENDLATRVELQNPPTVLYGRQRAG